MQNKEGKPIRVFLIDGNPAGMITAEIMNWTGHVLTGPRSKIVELITRKECDGPDPKGSQLPYIYVGEGEHVGKRIKDHNGSAQGGGKDFWERFCIFSSKDRNLTKGHIKFLESMLVTVATEAGCCILDNGTRPSLSPLPESDQAYMYQYLEQIKIIMPVLGFDFLRDPSKPTAKRISAEAISQNESPLFYIKIDKNEVDATAQEINAEFIVFEKSTVNKKVSEKGAAHYNLYQQLQELGVLIFENDKLLFVKDHVFSSPSSASGFICGRSSNGRTEWKTKDGRTYAGWQDEQIKKHENDAESIIDQS